MKFSDFLSNLPEVEKPTQKRLAFNEKLKWTLIVLVLFFILGIIPLFGLGENSLQRFEYLSIILGAEFGSLISLGIGPLVTASIVLQLLNGSGLLKFDLTKHEDKKMFQGLQKVLGVGFIIFEAAVYVFMGGLAPATQYAGTSIYLQLQLILVFQLLLGGILIMLMDEVVSKWGFGSGISLFIAAGVSKSLFLRLVSPVPLPGTNTPTGAIPALFTSLSSGDPQTATLMIAGIVATVIVFAISVFTQAMKVEIPLSFGRVRGQGIRWPLNFIYTSNIPVILVAALLANVELWARLLQNAGHPILGTFSGNSPATGIVAWLSGSQDILGSIIKGNFQFLQLAHAGVYMLFMIGGSVLFSIFWVQTSGMDAKALAKNMMNMGLQIPGFRRDERVMERLLQRYITPLTVMGAITVGFLASAADLLGALSRGTGILLTVMIIYRLYEDISKQHMMDMNPMMRKFMGEK